MSNPPIDTLLVASQELYPMENILVKRFNALLERSENVMGVIVGGATNPATRFHLKTNLIEMLTRWKSINANMKSVHLELCEYTQNAKPDAFINAELLKQYVAFRKEENAGVDFKLRMYDTLLDDTERMLGSEKKSEEKEGEKTADEAV